MAGKRRGWGGPASPWFWICMLTLALLSSIKILFLGLNVDEEYALAMAWRILGPDAMWSQMWEPHQSSGFLAAGLLGAYMQIRGDGEYALIFVRAGGLVLQALVAWRLYAVWRRIEGRPAAGVLALWYFLHLPKWISTPEFSNMLLGFSLLLYLAYVEWSMGGSKWHLWQMGLWMSLLVLAYPSCVLLFPIVLCLLWRQRGSRPGAYLWHFILPCGLGGTAYLLYFGLSLGWGNFFQGVLASTRDGSHSAGWGERLKILASQLADLAPHALAVCLLALALASLAAWRTGSGVRGCLPYALAIAALTEQMFVWLFLSRDLLFPYLYGFVFYGLGLVLYQRGAGELQEGHKRALKAGLVLGFFLWLLAYLPSNTQISATASYLHLGIMAGISLLWRRYPAGRALLAWALLGLTLFARGFLVYGNMGAKDDIFLVRQKALYGPAKGVYCHYNVGFRYNFYAEMLPEHIAPGERWMLVARNSSRYMLGSGLPAHYSTISTPTFDQRLWQYWGLHPECAPLWVVTEEGYGSLPFWLPAQNEAGLAWTWELYRQWDMDGWIVRLWKRGSDVSPGALQ